MKIKFCWIVPKASQAAALVKNKRKEDLRDRYDIGIYGIFDFKGETIISPLKFFYDLNPALDFIRD